jgi:PD-(D/E)XK endonuclease
MGKVPNTSDASHYLQSSLREKLLEHVFVGELLQCLWRAKRRDIEVLRAETDASGYDLVFESNGVLRHVQFKSSHRDARTRNVNVHVSLAKKPSGCVIWIVFDADTLKLGPFRWFGASPGQPLPNLAHYPVAHHVKGNRAGKKAPRPNLRVLGRADFKELPNIDSVAVELFGILDGDRLAKS